MKLSQAIKPVSYLGEHAEEAVRRVAETGPLVIVQDGKAKAVLMDIRQYEEMFDALALHELLALSEKSLAEKGGRPAREVFAELRRRSGSLESVVSGESEAS